MKLLNSLLQDRKFFLTEVIEGEKLASNLSDTFWDSTNTRVSATDSVSSFSRKPDYKTTFVLPSFWDCRIPSIILTTKSPS